MEVRRVVKLNKKRIIGFCFLSLIIIIAFVIVFNIKRKNIIINTIDSEEKIKISEITQDSETGEYVVYNK